MRDAVSAVVASLPESVVTGIAPRLRCADRVAFQRELVRQITAKSFDGYIRQRILTVFDSAGELAMNDAMIAAEGQEDSMEAHDFVEMGKVSEETKGGLTGLVYDGVPTSRWNG